MTTGIEPCEKPRVQQVANPPAARLLPLDVLRGIAILLVLFRHPVVPSSAAGFFRPLAERMETIGWTGVDLFFVLSGFLVGSLLFEEIRTTGRVDVGRFLIRRGLKIWPGYFVLLLVAFIQQIRHMNLSAGEALHSLLPNLFHLQNYFASPRGRTWSLAMEEHFYLTLPVLLSLLAWKKREAMNAIPAVPWIAVSLGVICLGIRCWLDAAVPFNTSTHLAPTHLRIDSLFWGVLLGYFYVFRPELFTRIAERRTKALACALAFIAPMFVLDLDTRFAHTAGFTMLYLGYGILLMLFVSTEPGSGLLGRLLYSPIGRAMAWMGVLSYSMFLWHYDFGELVLMEHLTWIVPQQSPDAIRWSAGLLLYVALVTAVGFIMSKLIEEPALKLRNRIWPSRMSQSPAAPKTRQ